MQLQVLKEQQGTSNWWGGATDEAIEGTWIWPQSQASVGDFIWGGNDPDMVERVKTTSASGLLMTTWG